MLFLAIGDTGTGDRAQYDVAAQLAKAHAIFPFTFRGDITKTTMTAVGFDTDRSYMLVEIAGEVLTFQTLSRTDTRVGSGTIRRSAPVPSTAAAPGPTKN